MRKPVSKTKRNQNKRKNNVKVNDNMNNLFWWEYTMFVSPVLVVNQNYIVALLANMLQ